MGGLHGFRIRRPPGDIADRALEVHDRAIIAVLQTDQALPGAIVEAFGDGSIVVVPLRDIEVPPGKALEVWTLFDKERGLVSLGLFSRAERVRFQSAGLPARVDQLYEITLEPESGSPVGRPQVQS